MKSLTLLLSLSLLVASTAAQATTTDNPTGGTPTTTTVTKPLEARANTSGLNEGEYLLQRRAQATPVKKDTTVKARRPQAKPQPRKKPVRQPEERQQPTVLPGWPEEDRD